jgi:hypothetical protein
LRKPLEGQSGTHGPEATRTLLFFSVRILVIYVFFRDVPGRFIRRLPFCHAAPHAFIFMHEGLYVPYAAKMQAAC